jgi:hypothetical protein
VIFEIDEENELTGSDADSKFSLIDDISQNDTRSTGGDITQLFDKDMDMNEGNFNLIKNSNVFKRNKNRKRTGHNQS